MSVELRNQMNETNSNRNSLILQQQQQHSNRNSLIKDHTQQPTSSNRSSLDVSQSSYNTLIIHENKDNQSLFSGAGNPTTVIKQEYYVNSSPSPPTYVMKKDKSSSRSRSFGTGSPFSTNLAEIIVQTPENEQYLNQSYVLKHLAKEVKIPKPGNTNNDSTRDSGVSDNNSSNNNWLLSTSSNESGSGVSTNSRNKSKSQPDLTKYCNVDNNSNDGSNSNTANINFNDFEQLEIENNKLREQLNDSLMKKDCFALKEVSFGCSVTLKTQNFNQFDISA